MYFPRYSLGFKPSNFQAGTNQMTSLWSADNRGEAVKSWNIQSSLSDATHLPSHIVVSGENLSRKWQNCISGRNLDTAYVGCAYSHQSTLIPRSTERTEGQRVRRKEPERKREKKRQLQNSLKTDEQTQFRDGQQQADKNKRQRWLCWPF